MGFREDSPNTIPLHLMNKEWLHTFESEGKVYVEHVERSQHGGYLRRNSHPMTPVKAEELIKALKRTIKDAKKSGGA